MVSGRKDETLTYSRYVKDETSGESVADILKKKADTDGVVIALENKVGRDELDEMLDEKADQEAMEAQLAKKVNIADNNAKNLTFNGQRGGMQSTNTEDAVLEVRRDASDAEAALREEIAEAHELDDGQVTYDKLAAEVKSKIENASSSLKIGTTSGTAFDGAEGKKLSDIINGADGENGLPTSIVRSVSVDASADRVTLYTSDASLEGTEWGYSDDNGHEIAAATEDTAGVMSAADKKRLNAVDLNAIGSATKSATDAAKSATDAAEKATAKSDLAVDAAATAVGKVNKYLDIVKLPVVEVAASGEALAMDANKVYDITVGESLTLTLNAPTETGIVNEWSGSFDTGTTAPTVTWPADVVWAETPSVVANTHCEFNIRYSGGKYYGLIQAWNLTTEESV